MDSLNKREFADLLIGSSGGKLRCGVGKHKEIRLHPVEKNSVYTRDNANDLFDQVGLTLKNTIYPKAPGSCSGKFVTYSFNETEHKVVIGGTGNAGSSFEIFLANMIKSKNKELLKKLELTKSSVLEINHKKHTTRRKLSFDPHHIGSSVADITLLLSDNERRYVSLKFGDKTTVANYGIGKLLTTKFTVIKKQHELLSVFGVDVWKLEQGIKAYRQHDKIASVSLQERQETTLYDSSKLCDFLLASIGYGYWAISGKDSTVASMKVMNIATVEDTKKLVGNSIVKASIKYPYWTGADNNKNSKQTTVHLTTDTDKRFILEFRNSKGQLNPTELKVRWVF